MDGSEVKAIGMDESEALGFAVEAAKAAQIAAEKAVARGPNYLPLIEHLLGPITVLIVLFIIYLNRKSLGNILERVTGVKVMGVEVELNAGEQLSKAVDLDTRIETTVPGGKKKIQITEEDERRAIKRAANAIDVLKGRTVLWVDDLPANNLHEAKALKELGLNVIQVNTNEAAIEKIVSGDLRAHVVISDISRPNGQPDGIALLDDFAAYNIDIPVIYYITNVDERVPLPAAQDGATAFGLTNRPDELIHLVLDVLERRWPLS